MTMTAWAKRLILTILILVLNLPLTVLAYAADLRIIHINDLHGWVELPPQSDGDGELGGATRLAAAVNTRRQEKPSIFLAAGDMIQGSSWTNYFKGRSTIELLNLMGLDAMVVGNHEFDFGVAELEVRIREAAFPMLAANVAGVPGLKPLMIKEIDGLKVAIIGLITPQTARISAARHLCQVEFLPPEKTLKKILPQAKKHADIVVILSHLGLAEDVKLASQVGGIDIIVGGHSHSRLNTPHLVKNTLIVQAWEHGKTLGILDLQVRDRRIVRHQGRLETITAASGQGDGAVRDLVQKYQKEVDAALGQEIGAVSVCLDGRNVRRQETNLGNWLADIIRQATGADLAILNGGGIRRSLAAGPIRLRDIHEIIPFENLVVALEITGRQVRQALEHGLARLPQAAPRFPQVSGIRLQYDPAAPPGGRVLSVQVGDQPLRDDARYVLATVDFLAAGGDGYWMFPPLFGCPGGPVTKKKPPPGRLVWHDPDRTLKEIVGDYVKTCQSIAPTIEGRIRAKQEQNNAMGWPQISRQGGVMFRF